MNPCWTSFSMASAPPLPAQSSQWWSALLLPGTTAEHTPRGFVSALHLVLVFPSSHRSPCSLQMTLSQKYQKGRQGHEINLYWRNQALVAVHVSKIYRIKKRLIKVFLLTTAVPAGWHCRDSGVSSSKAQCNVVQLQQEIIKVRNMSHITTFL